MKKFTWPLLAGVLSVSILLSSCAAPVTSVDSVSQQPQESSTSSAASTKSTEDISEAPAEMSEAEGEDDSLSRIQEKGTLIVGMNASFAPCEFHMMVDGKDTIVGFDVDLANEIAKDMGVEMQIQEMEFAALISSLVAGQVDVVISGLAETEERRKSIDFSTPYYRDDNVALIRVEDKDRIKSVEDLQDKNIGIEMNTVEQTIAEDQLPDAQHTIMESWSALQLALKAGQIDALLSSGLTAQICVARNPELMIAENSVLDDSVLNYKGSGVGVRKGSDALVEQINKTIDRLLASGEMDQFVEDACALAAQIDE